MDQEREARPLVPVRMLQSMAGLVESWVPGDIVQVEAHVADAWHEAGIASRVEPMPDPEQATAEGAPERATRRRTR